MAVAENRPSTLNEPAERERLAPRIAFRRHLPAKTIDPVELFKRYLDYEKRGPLYVTENLGTTVLHEADPQHDTRDRNVAGNLAMELVHQTGRKPDIIIVITSHLPQRERNNPNAQRVAMQVRERLATWDMADSLDKATPENTKTISAACTGFVVVLDWLRQMNPRGASVLIVIDETGYRRTLFPPSQDKGKTALLMSDAAIALQFTYGEDVEVLSSKIYDEYLKNSHLLKMRVPDYDRDDRFLLVYEVPYADHFTMDGPGLRTLFHSAMTPQAVDSIREEAGVRKDQLSLVASHQASKPMVGHAYEMFPEVPYKPYGIKKYGNTSSASIPLDLADGMQSSAIKQADLGLLLAFGARPMWGGAVVRL